MNRIWNIIPAIKPGMNLSVTVVLNEIFLLIMIVSPWLFFEDKTISQYPIRLWRV